MEETQSDRAAVIVCAALLEDGLTRAIQSTLHRDKAVLEKLFRPSGPLGSFSAKIDLAFAMGLYSKEIHKDLVTIKNIRNEFAHGLTTKNLGSQKVRDLCDNIEIDALNFTIRGVHRKDRIRATKMFIDLDKTAAGYRREKFKRACQVLLVLLGGFLRKRPRRPAF